MKAVMYGGGNIGRGFIGALFSASGYRVTFVDVAKPVVESLNEKGSYLWEYEDEGASIQVKVTMNEEGKPEAVTSIVPAGTEIGESGLSMVIESVVTTTEE